MPMSSGNEIIYSLIRRSRNRAGRILAGDLSSVWTYRTARQLQDRMNHFSCTWVAILVDENTCFEKIPRLLPPHVKIAGYYSFSLDTIGTTVNGFTVQPVMQGKVPVEVDAWLLFAHNDFAGYSLSSFLLETGKAQQAVLWGLNSPSGTTYYSYIDFFHNEQQKTIVQIHNYFKRCYGIPFPVDIKYTLRSLSGEIASAGQFIIPPNGVYTVSGSDFKISSFEGYLEIEFDITTRVMPFLHYYATYISENSIACNHQSGLGLQQAGSVFARGYIPADEKETMMLCLFQRHYDQPVVTKGTLRYTEGSSEKILTKELPGVKKNHVIYTDVKKLFPEIDFTKITGPSLYVSSPVPLHRPNFFYKRYDAEGFYDVTHSAGEQEVAAVYTKGELKKIEEMGYIPLQTGCLVMPPGMGITSLVGLWQNANDRIRKFCFEFYDTGGDLKFSREEVFDPAHGTYLNINRYLEKYNVELSAGTFIMRAAESSGNIPKGFLANVGYRSEKRDYMSSTATGLGFANSSFYFNGGPSGYIGKGVLHTSDIYGPGRVSDDFDTCFLLGCPSSEKEAKKKQVSYEISIYNSMGEERKLNKKIFMQGSAFLSLSELVKESKHYSDDGSYCVWFYSPEAFIYAYWLLYRKSDGAITVEHCYGGKYGL